MGSVHKLFNTNYLVEMFTSVFEKSQVRSGTKAGVGFTLYVKAIIEQAEVEGIDVARRNLDRQVAMLVAMRTAPHADAMEQVAMQHSVESQKREMERRD